MPQGKIAGFNRPLTEGEIIIQTAYLIEKDFGLSLDDGGKRAEFEDDLAKFLADSLLSGTAKEMTIPFTVKASPAGRMLGVKIATNTDEIGGVEGIASGFALSDIVEVLKKIPEEVDKVRTFTKPGAYRNFGEPQDRLHYTIKCA